MKLPSKYWDILLDKLPNIKCQFGGKSFLSNFKKINCAGYFDAKSFCIKVLDGNELSFYHELFHAISCKNEEECGLTKIINGKQYGMGLNEGITELLTSTYFEKENKSAYYLEQLFAVMIIDFVGFDMIETLYINHNLTLLTKILNDKVMYLNDKIFALEVISSFDYVCEHYKNLKIPGEYTRLRNEVSGLYGANINSTDINVYYYNASKILRFVISLYKSILIEAYNNDDITSNDAKIYFENKIKPFYEQIISVCSINNKIYIPSIIKEYSINNFDDIVNDFNKEINKEMMTRH